MKKSFAIVGVAMLVLSSSWPLWRTEHAAAQSRSRVKQPHYQVLWNWLQRSNYRGWTTADGKQPDFQPGESPHGALIKIYTSKVVQRDPKTLQDGAVLVKENYSPDKKLMAITVMQRAKGFDTANGDWYYAKYKPNGEIDRTPPEMKNMPVAGKFMMCIDCHRGAGGKDFAFFNDQ